MPPVPHNRLFFISFIVTLAFGAAASAHAEGAFSFGDTPETEKTAPAPTHTSGETGLTQTVVPQQYKMQNDLWQRIREGFAMNDVDSPLIARHEQWYANRPDYVARMTERAGRYLYFIVEEVERRGMPTEIALLPMIESAFNPSAYSIGHASGIWQFIPSTGKDFGLQQNWWYDGRRDIISATRGALDYLQKLHDQFGDWELALAAYNWGEGAVQRAQERNRRQGLPTDYASLRMPDETRNYVPKLIAVKNIVSNPASFGLNLQAVSNQPYFTAVSTAEHIDVKVAAQLADIPLDEFMALNPAHSRPVILQSNSNIILLPVQKIETFRANLEHSKQPLVNWQAYQSKKGERLDKLAPRYGLSVEKLRSVNGLSSQTLVSGGQTLLVPLNGETADSEFEAFNMHLAPVTPRIAPAAQSKLATQSKSGKPVAASTAKSSKTSVVAQKGKTSKGTPAKLAAHKPAAAKSTKVSAHNPGSPAKLVKSNKPEAKPASRAHVALNR
ncbi:MAG: transglycosylase SLT domain-containing protein [Nitrosomonadales bacterium]|nr:transglycosylase SLT domain-containing protein [Nitrosomonadales bacterium]